MQLFSIGSSETGTLTENEGISSILFINLIHTNPFIGKSSDNRLDLILSIAEIDNRLSLVHHVIWVVPGKEIFFLTYIYKSLEVRHASFLLIKLHTYNNSINKLIFHYKVIYPLNAHSKIKCTQQRTVFS